MRIVMLLGRSTGGIGTHVVELADGLRAAGDDVSVVTDPLTAERFSLDRADLWWPRRSAGVRGSARNLRQLRALVSGADVVHAHGHQAGLLAAVAATGTGTPVVVSQHNAVPRGTGPRGFVSRVAQDLVARRAALVTGASSDLVEEARRHGARDARLAPVPSPRVPALLAQEPLAEPMRHRLAANLLREHGIEPASRDPQPSDGPGGHDHRDPSRAAARGPGAAALVVTVARLAPQKDLDTLVRAAARVASADPPLHAAWVVVGAGDEPLRERLVERARAQAAPVHFVGPQDDPGRWLRAADVFVLTSLWEARALVVQEAMAAGVPVVATDTGGLPDLVDGVGTLVRVGDDAAVCAAVRRYLGDPAARRTAVRAGRDRATSWDDGRATARRWREWYSDLPGMT